MMPMGDGQCRRCGSMGSLSVDDRRSYPPPAAQCRDWLRATVPGATVVDSLSNATAAIQVAEGEHDAALTTALAAGAPGLAVRAEHVADHRDAVTRFVVVTRPAPPPP